MRRRLTALFNRLFRSRGYYVKRYYGADFLLAPHGIGALEASAGILEHPELTYLVNRCAELRPEMFIDVGANIGIYTCILLRNGAAPRAMLFEPDRVNRVQLRANLMINGLLERAEVHEFALGAENTRFRLLPGAVTRRDYKLADGGFSMVVEDDSFGDSAYEVDVARFDDRFQLAGQTLAIKMDIEHYECKALAGMERTLRQNRCIVQVESYAMHEQVTAMMTSFGYQVVKDFMPNFVFEKRH